MKKSRVLAAVLAGTMVMGTLAACGSNNGNSDNKSDGQNTNNDGNEDVATNPDDFYEVVMQWPTAGDAPSGLADVEAEANKLLAEIGCTLKLEPVNAFNLANETSLAVSSGEKLDISLSLFSGIGSLVSNGSLLQLDDLLDQYGQDIKTECTESMLTGGLYGDKMYAVPIAFMDGSDLAFNCRKDILDKYNIEYDNSKYYTMDEIEDIFATIKAGEGDNFYMVASGFDNGFPFGAWYSVDNLGQSLASGGIMIDDSGDTTIQNIYATDEFAEYAQRMYEWHQKGYISPDASTDTESSTTLIQSGNYLGTFANAISMTTSETGDADCSFKNETGYDGVSLHTGKAVCMTSNYTSVLWSIPATSEKPEKAMQVLNFLYKSPEFANLLRYGIEGQSYVVLEDNGTTKLIDFPEGQNMMTVPYYQMFGIYGNRLKWYIQSPNPITMNDELKEFSDSITRKSPALGYVFNIDNVSAKYAAVDSVIQQYQKIINSGSIDPSEELPQFLDALKTAGIDDVIAENQSQFDAWLAAK